MDLEPKLDSSSRMNMQSSSPIYHLPIELLAKIIKYTPMTQWHALELVDPNLFLNATLHAWGSIRKVDVRRDFNCSESKTNKDDVGDEMIKGTLCRDISRKTASILKKLSERSPLITSISMSLLSKDASMNTTAIQYLSRFEHLETIKFTYSDFSVWIEGRRIEISSGIHLVNLTDFIESTRSRATLKDISIAYCHIPDDAIDGGDQVERLRAAFSNDQWPQSLRMESLSLHSMCNYNDDDDEVRYPPMDFLVSIDLSRMTKLSFGRLEIEPAILTTLINGAPRLRHIDFAFIDSCLPECNGERLQSNVQLLAALESHQQLISLGFNTIWGAADFDVDEDCACKKFEAAFLQMLDTIGPQLENFVFAPGTLSDDISMNEICWIIQNRMPRLKSINLEECIQDPEDLRGIADMKDLKEIELRDTSFFDVEGTDESKETMNDVLSTIISKSLRLKRFDVWASGYHPDQRVVMELYKLKYLVEFSLGGCNFTNKNFVAFSQSFASKLEVLDVGHIDEGVESGLIQFIAKANQLRDLTVGQNKSDRLLECVAVSCPNLEQFSTRWVDSITIQGLQTLADGCPNLRGLFVKDVFFTMEIHKTLKIDKYRKLRFRC